MRRRSNQSRGPSRRQLIDSERLYGDIRLREGAVSVGLAYPNRYGVGMANLGYQTILHRIRSIPGVSAERVFLGDGDGPLKTFETQKPVGGLGALLFSVSFENDYVNLVRMLTKARIPLDREERDDRHPMIVVGGAITFLNPEPLRKYADVMLTGEGEEIVCEYIERLQSDQGEARAERVRRAATIAGAYVPAVHGCAGEVERRSYMAMKHDPALTRILTPHSEFSDTLLMEISRGCPRRCRFCTVGSAFPKFRMLPADEAVEIAERFRAEDVAAGRRPVNKVGLVTAAFFDHIESERMAEMLFTRGFEIGASSVRVDQLTLPLLEYLRKSGLQALTIAPEAGTERLRKIIAKEATDEKIMAGVSKVAAAGFRSLRIYYMVGLPFETEHDRAGLVSEAMRIRSHFYNEINGSGRVTVSLHPFVPKPRTSFQWSAMRKPKDIKRIVLDIRKQLPGIRVKCPSHKDVYLEGILARGGEDLAPFLESVAAGSNWQAAARETNLPLEELIYSDRPGETVFPWEREGKDRVDRVNWREFQRASDLNITEVSQVHE